MLLAVAGIAIVLGFVGGLASHAAFPAPAGPTGPAGSSGAVPTGNLGYCFNVSYFTDNAGTTSYTWVSGVTLVSPTLQSGTQSCPTGTFIPLTPSTSPAA
jgi:hypothetical protein